MVAVPEVTIAIPVVHHLHTNVTDYPKVELLLKRTVYSCLQQRHVDPRIIVVGTKVPRWFPEDDPHLLYVDVGCSDQFAGKLDVRLDKGLKYLLSLLLSEILFGDSRLMVTADADDYLHGDVCSAVNALDQKLAHKPIDGYIWTRGLNVLVRDLGDGNLDCTAAIEIDQFNKACGTCRVFRVDRLSRLADEKIHGIERLRDWLSSLHLETQGGPILSFPAELEAEMRAILVAENIGREDLVPVLGRHIRQRRIFKIRYLPWVGGAKGCGHGQHDGPNRGALHLRRKVRSIPIEDFLTSFGLAPVGDVPEKLPIRLQRRADKLLKWLRWA